MLFKKYEDLALHRFTMTGTFVLVSTSPKDFHCWIIWQEKNLSALGLRPLKKNMVFHGVDRLVSDGQLRKQSRISLPIPESLLRSLEWFLEDCVIKVSGISGAQASWGALVPDATTDLRQVEEKHSLIMERPCNQCNWQVFGTEMGSGFKNLETDT